MSHFTVVVIGDDVEGQLAPYDENIEMPPYVDEDADPWRDELAAALKYHTDKGNDHVLEDYERARKVDELEAALWMLNEQWSHGWERRGDELVQMSTYNPKSEWDWWTVGGRWNGFFYGKADALVTAPTPHWGDIAGPDNPVSDAPFESQAAYEEAMRGRTDQARKGEIDFEFPRLKAAGEAAAEYDKYAQAVAGIEPAARWEEVVRLCMFDRNIDPDKPYNELTDQERAAQQEAVQNARQAYNSHPWVKAIREVDENAHWRSNLRDYYMVDSDNPRQDFIDARVDSVYVPYAIVHEGQWISKGKMGWWGMSSGDQPQEVWNKKVRELYDSLDDDTMLTLVDCHI